MQCHEECRRDLALADRRTAIADRRTARACRRTAKLCVADASAILDPVDRHRTAALAALQKSREQVATATSARWPTTDWPIHACDPLLHAIEDRTLDDRQLGHLARDVLGLRPCESPPLVFARNADPSVRVPRPRAGILRVGQHGADALAVPADARLVTALAVSWSAHRVVVEIVGDRFVANGALVEFLVDAAHDLRFVLDDFPESSRVLGRGRVL